MSTVYMQEKGWTGVWHQGLAAIVAAAAAETVFAQPLAAAASSAQCSEMKGEEGECRARDGGAREQRSSAVHAHSSGGRWGDGVAHVNSISMADTVPALLSRP